MNSCWIGLVETWSERPSFSFYSLSGFNSVVSPAVKIKSKGRAKGGLILLNNIRLTSLINLLYRDPHCIVARYKFENSGIHVIVAVTYFAPSLTKQEVEECLERLEKVAFDYANEPLIIAGDFNSRIGNLNGHALSDYNEYLCEERNSADRVVNSRGNQLQQFCQDNDLVVLNGRTVSDNIGEFTFVETTGASVIDYIMVNSPAIKHVRDMIVKSTSCSAHSALHLILVCNLMKHNSPVNQEPRIIFKQSNVMNFHERFQSNLIYCKSNLSYESFKNCLFQLHWNVKWYNRKEVRKSQSHGLITIVYNKKFSWEKPLRQPKEADGI